MMIEHFKKAGFIVHALLEALIGNIAKCVIAPDNFIIS